MQSLYSFLIGLGASLGFCVGLAHIGFALSDAYPRKIWDWYVVAMGLGMFAMAFPATLHLARS